MSLDYYGCIIGIRYGITHKDDSQANPNFVPIGDLQLIQTRRQKKRVVDNGGFMSIDEPQITLGGFIPFYFGIRMPMLYVVQHGWNFVEKREHPEKVVYLVCYVIMSLLVKN